MKFQDEIQKTRISNIEIFYSGNIDLLRQKKIGIFASRDAPQSIVIPAEKFVFAVSKLPYVFISGWHSSFEKKIFEKLLLLEKEIIFFTSLGIRNMRMDNHLIKTWRNGRLLIISFFEDNPKMTSLNALRRNEMISDISEKNLFLYVNNNGNLRNLIPRLSKNGRNPLVFNNSKNFNYLKNCASIDINNYEDLL